MSEERDNIKSNNINDQKKKCLERTVDRFEKAHARSLIMEVIFFLILITFLLLFIFYM